MTQGHTLGAHWLYGHLLPHDTQAVQETILWDSERNVGREGGLGASAQVLMWGPQLGEGGRAVRRYQDATHLPIVSAEDHHTLCAGIHSAGVVLAVLP